MARIEVRIVDPKRVRSFAQARGQAYDAAREELVQIVNARQALLEQQTQMQNRCEHTVPTPVRKMHERLLKAIALEVIKLEARPARTLPKPPRSSRACRDLARSPLPAGMFAVETPSECTHPPCPWPRRYPRQRDHFVLIIHSLPCSVRARSQSPRTEEQHRSCLSLCNKLCRFWGVTGSVPATGGLCENRPFAHPGRFCRTGRA